jgi:hypothetical protein
MASKKLVLSMGSAVEVSECSICGSKGHTEHVAGAAINTDPVFIAASIVRAPPCFGCRLPMTYLWGTDWACKNPDCEQENVPVTTGIGGLVRELKDD